MMNEHNEEETPAPGAEAAAEDVIDKVCDPFGLVPDNLEEAFAHKKKVKDEKAKEDEVKAEAQALLNGEPYVAPSTDEKGACDMLSNFNIDCCGKAPAANEEVQDKEFPAEKLPADDENVDEQILNNGENASVMTGNNSQQLAEIAAKMDEIDLETAAEDTAADQISDTDSLRKSMDADWYRQPLYASLIVLSGLFSIAIVVMAILLITN